MNEDKEKEILQLLRNSPEEGITQAIEVYGGPVMVSYMAARGITSGTEGNLFSPDAALTRGQFIALLLRSYDISPDASPSDTFTDSGNAYYTGYLAAAKRLGITQGIGDNKFAPEQAITRQDMVTMLYNALRPSTNCPRAIRVRL